MGQFILILIFNNTKNLLQYNDMIYAYYLQHQKVLCITYYITCKIKNIFNTN